MRIIIKLTSKYMKLNRRRTLATIAGICGAMLAVTAFVLFTDTLLGMLRESVAESEGSYHVIFHDITEEQFDQLKKCDKIASCFPVSDCGNAETGLICAKAELKKVNLLIFRRAQSIARDIGMSPLPEDERMVLPDRGKGTYNVTYHMEILKYYGISDTDSAGIGVIMKVILAALIITAGILIYNSFAISLFEKKKYIGTLDGIGATSVQKSMCVYTEGIICGIIGIPSGIFLGYVLMRILVYMLAGRISTGNVISVHMGAGTATELAGLGLILILIACSIPAGDAASYSGIEMIFRQVQLNPRDMKLTNLLSERKHPGPGTRIAIRNIMVNNSKYLINGILLAAAFCVLVDGIAYMRGLRGDYYPAEEGSRPELESWIEVYSQNTDQIEEAFQSISVIRNTQDHTLERKLDIEGVIIPENELRNTDDGLQIQAWHGLIDGKQEIADAGTGNVVRGVWVPLSVIGLDDKTFSSYVSNIGCSGRVGSYATAIIEDNVAMNDGNYTGRRRLLALNDGARFRFVYSRYGDMSGYNMISTGSQIPEFETRTGNISVLAVTSEAPPTSYFSAMHDNITGYKERQDGEIRIYLPIGKFNELINQPTWCDTYSRAGSRGTDSKTIQTVIKFNATDEDRKQVNASVRKVLKAAGLAEGQAYDVDKNKGLWLPADGSFYYSNMDSWRRDNLMHSETFLVMLLGFGVVIIITALSLSNIFQNIAMSLRTRSRELALYLSMGMTERQVRQMLAAENSTYGIAGCILGIPISLLALYGVYMDYSDYIVDWKLPWDLVAAEMVIALMIIAVPSIHTAAQLKYMNIIETIRNENS